MNEVIVTISVSVRSALMRAIAVMPSMFGIRRSISTTSGSSRRAIATPSEPSDASPTTSMSSWRSKKVRSPVRTTAWSSTRSTRILELSSTSSPAAGLPRCGAVRIGDGQRESSKGALRSASMGGRNSRRLDGREQLARAERLADEPVGAALGKAVLERIGPAHHEDADAGGSGPKRADQADTAVDVWQARIEHDEVGVCAGGEIERRARIAGRTDD